ncbi:MAG: hypothetical protein ACRER5_16060 [Pseudomonas sp.]
MSAQQIEPDDELPDDLDEMLDDLPAKKGAKPLVRTPAQQAKQSLVAAQAASAQQAAMLAQIVNLHIAGFSLAQIGQQIGASADEVDRMLSTEAARYVRNQPALRTYVRNFISSKYLGLLEAVWDQSVDQTNVRQLEYVDRSQRILAQMGRLHGAEAPTQSEVKVEATPEAVDKIVQAIAAGQGLGYDTDIFDIDPADIHEAVITSAEQVEVSGNAVETQEEGESDDGF